MGEIKDIVQSADWKQEKHVPVIETSDKAKKGEMLKITVTVGKEIPHPNKTEHHIRWISVYFHPRGEKFPCQIGKVEFTAHGESPQGPDTSTICTHPEAVLNFKSEKSGTIYAVSYCNIHGLWQNSKEIEVA
ncbi:MAG: class II SORL domain-containing protein [Candidatus Omnitrophica bacterium]|nr:class II SORL domain-containing protein [Candidatus Omnitrophota bacterium]